MIKCNYEAKWSTINTHNGCVCDSQQPKLSICCSCPVLMRCDNTVSHTIGHRFTWEEHESRATTDNCRIANKTNRATTKKQNTYKNQIKLELVLWGQWKTPRANECEQKNKNQQIKCCKRSTTDRRGNTALPGSQLMCAWATVIAVEWISRFFKLECRNDESSIRGHRRHTNNGHETRTHQDS